MTPWTVAWQAPLSMGFSRQEYWSGLPPGQGRSSRKIRGSSLPRDRTQVSSIGRQILYHVSHRTIPEPLDLGEPREAGPVGNCPVRRWNQETGPCWGLYGTHRGLLPAPVLGLWPNPDRSRRHRAWEMHQGRGRHPGLQ